MGPLHAAGPRGEGIRSTKPRGPTRSAGAGPVPITGRQSRVAVVCLVDGRRRAQWVFAHLHGVAPRSVPDPDFHEPRIAQEPVMVRGVAITVRQAPKYRGHVRVEPPKGAHVPPPGGSPGQGIGVV